LFKHEQKGKEKKKQAVECPALKENTSAGLPVCGMDG
jgi:hypothetical protein